MSEPSSIQQPTAAERAGRRSGSRSATSRSQRRCRLSSDRGQRPGRPDAAGAAHRAPPRPARRPARSGRPDARRAPARPPSEAKLASSSTPAGQGHRLQADRGRGAPQLGQRRRGDVLDHHDPGRAGRAVAEERGRPVNAGSISMAERGQRRAGPPGPVPSAAVQRLAEVGGVEAAVVGDVRSPARSDAGSPTRRWRSARRPPPAGASASSSAAVHLRQGRAARTGPGSARRGSGSGGQRAHRRADRRAPRERRGTLDGLERRPRGCRRPPEGQRRDHERGAGEPPQAGHGQRRVGRWSPRCC